MPPITSSHQSLPLRRANDGLELPAIGFGTYAVNGFTGVKTIVSALHQGYRLIDSAFNYENEGVVGKAIRDSGIPRDQIIVTSKLPGRHHRLAEAQTAIEESVERMGLDYIDLYLIHWPDPSKGLYAEAWQALIQARQQGYVRHIGVSNFLPGHIDQLIAQTGVTPAVNQVELHPFFQQREQRSYDEAHDIITEAWSPLGRANHLIGDPTITRIAEKHGLSTIQTILRWHVQIGDVAIPKATDPNHQRANIDLGGFSLDDEDMAAIARLDNPEGRTYAQDPRWYEDF